MNLNPSALAELRDIHLPEPIALWPLAPGWWLLVAALVLGVGLVVWSRRRAQRSPRRAALGEVQRLEAEYRSSGDGSALAGGLSALLRRVSLLTGERARVACLHGEARAASLAPGSPGISAQWLVGMEAALYQNPSRPVSGDDAEAWLGAVRELLRRLS